MKSYTNYTAKKMDEIFMFDVTKNMYDIIESYLMDDGDPNIKYKNMTLMSNAISFDDIDIVKLLMKYKVDLDVYVYTPYLFLSCYNSINIFEELIKYGADINATFNNESIIERVIDYSSNVQDLTNILLKYDYDITKEPVLCYCVDKETIYFFIELDAKWELKSSGVDFLDLVTTNLKNEIIEKYPKKYKDYLISKKASIFNI